MLTGSVLAALRQEGPAALVSGGADGPHLVSTWNSYINVLSDTTLAFPAGGFRQTESNVQSGSPVQMILGSRDEAGKGIGYRLTGRLSFESGTPLHGQLRERFPWCRAAVIMRVEQVVKVLG